MTSLLPRLGLRRWLAHKVLGWLQPGRWEYVELRGKRYVPWSGHRATTWLARAYDDGRHRTATWRNKWNQWEGWATLRADGSFGESRRISTRQPDSWHPLTPGVAGFYKPAAR